MEKLFLLLHLSKVFDLLQNLDLELSPRIGVFQSFFLHLDQNIREVAAKLVEYSFMDACHGAVVRALHTRRPWGVCQYGYLSEVVSLLKLLHKHIVFHMVFHPDHAVTFGN